MKIRLSLRVYFTIAMLLLGSSVILFFSSMSHKYFKHGLETALLHHFYYASRSVNVTQGNPETIMNITVSANWEDVPADIRQNIQTPPIKALELKKKLVRNNYFDSKPTFAYFVALIEDQEGHLEYVSSSIDIAKDVLVHIEGKARPSNIILCAGVITGVFFIIFLLFITKTISGPVEKLGSWAQNLHMSNLDKTLPDFKYSELNKLASLIKDSLISVKQSLEREKKFLDYSSHELRTPISIIQSNLELLRSLDNASDIEKKIYARLHRASNTMRDLTETILWLTQDNKQVVPEKTIFLDDVISKIFDEFSYMLQGKTVTTSLHLSSYQMHLPFAAEIVLTNLIRNALQHTYKGKVSIQQNNATVIITNENVSDQQEHSVNKSDLGFGLGLQLTCKLIERFSWQLTQKQYRGGYYVKVCFHKKHT